MIFYYLPTVYFKSIIVKAIIIYFLEITVKHQYGMYIQFYCLL